MVETEKKRGLWLTILLILMLIGNFFSALVYLVFNKTISLLYPKVALWVWYIYGVIGLAGFVFIIFLFLWKKWPFFAICGATILVSIIDLVIGFGVFAALFGLIGPLILYLSMKSRWNLFE